MNITIVGAGALGNLLATKLSKNNEVKLIVKAKHADLIENQEILFRDIKGNIIKSKIKIGTNIENCDLIILCVKSYDAKILIQKLSYLDTPLLLCQNGLKTLNYALENIDEKRLSYLVTGNGISKIKAGISEHKGLGFTYLGNLSKLKSNILHNISNSLKEQDMDCSIVENIEEYVWLKTVINSAINPIATLGEVKNGELRNPGLNDEVKNLCVESSNIASSNGINLPLDPWQEINKIIEKTANNKCSMLQDLENNQQTEIDSINGELIRIGEKLSINPIYNQQVFSEIKKLSQ
ncbi:MAG TPA: 2-dehydropantoate 2-reductase [Candidatus Poseidoniia archaeon]|jgi:2-dehydropantoate 2-reductase|nr:2-dehydropantoate 2-reductase [Candidatus Poseidoniia archaeon]|tara:strand:+ start:114 stop:995 length:882 start_codon:yes stop_codon:yes gene_type:complete